MEHFEYCAFFSFQHERKSVVLIENFKQLLRFFSTYLYHLYLLLKRHFTQFIYIQKKKEKKRFDTII